MNSATEPSPQPSSQASSQSGLLFSRLEPHLTRIAIGLWIVLGLATIGRALVLHGMPRHTSEGFGIFMQAGEHWLNTQNLYQSGDSLRAFRNSPLVGAAFAPLSAMKPSIASSIVRFVSFVSVVAGLWLLVRSFIAPRYFRLACPWIFLLALVLCFQPLGDVQTNGLSAGLLALGIAMTQRKKFWLAAAFLVLAVHVKAYPIALLMLLLALFPLQLALPTLVAIIATFAITFLFQRTDFVWQQWEGWIRYGLNNRQGPGGENVFRDIRVLLRLFNVSMSPNAYLVLEAATGFAILCWAFWIRRFVSRTQLLLTTYILAAAWMTVFGPATESQTYVHFAPACAMAVWCFTRPTQSTKPYSNTNFGPAGLFALAGWALLALTQVALWFPRGSSLHLYGLHSAGGLLVIFATILWSTRPAPQDQLA